MPRYKIRVAPELGMPVDSLTERFSLLGRTGAGKSYNGGILVEEFLAAKQQVVIVDPQGGWWGLRSSADGKGPGYPIVVMGGSHGDIPLEPTSGSLVADLITGEGISAILDFSLFDTDADEIRFMIDFTDRLFRKNKHPMHLVIDESDSFAPQHPMKNENVMLNRIKRLAKRGRSKGIGLSLLTQRAAALNKNVLSQTEILIALQTTAPQDRKAIKEWVQGKGTEEEQEMVLSSLASLKTGEAWVWSPTFLKLLRKVKFRTKRTFDSSATPKVGARKRTPKVLAKVDLEKFKKRMEKTLEKAKQDNPDLLRGRIRELEREVERAKRLTGERDALAKKVTTKKIEVHVVEIKKIEVPLIKKSEFNKLERLVKRCERIQEKLGDDAGRFDVFTRQLWSDVTMLQSRAEEALKKEKRRKVEKPVEKPQRAVRIPSPRLVQPEVDGEIDIKAGARRMLQNFACFNPDALTKNQVGTLSKISPSSGTFSQYFSSIVRAGFVEECDGGFTISKAGFDFLNGDYRDRPGSKEELMTMWGSVLKAGERRMVETLVQAMPDTLTHEELGEATNIAHTSGTFSQYASSIKRNGLAEKVGKAEIKAGNVFELVGLEG